MKVEEASMVLPLRATALLAVAALIAACAAPAASPSPEAPTPGASPTEAATASPAATATAEPSPTAGVTESPAAIDIPNVVCVGEATTYLDWLEGSLEPDDPDPITEPADTTGDLLEIVRQNGVLRISSDADYAPQSSINPDTGEFEGFDVDVGTEIATRLGVDVEFMHVDWDLITAGSWAERWDISVGSMTITTPRKELLSFTRPYYFTPAGMAVSSASGVTSVEQLPFELPEGATATTLPTDLNCAEAIRAARGDFELWISALPTIQEAINQGIGLTIIGDPIFTEGLGVAIDKSGPPHDALLFEIDRIIDEMHEDGTLTELSMTWYDEDLTQDPEVQ
jgi:polar amino acid transport system substrate-binding protein